MVTLSNLSYTPSDESILHHLTALPLPADADLFKTAEHCAALVSVLVETDDAVGFTALCECLLRGLRQLRELCDAELPPYLVAQLIVGEKVTSCVPEVCEGAVYYGALIKLYVRTDNPVSKTGFLMAILAYFLFWQRLKSIEY